MSDTTPNALILSQEGTVQDRIIPFLLREGLITHEDLAVAQEAKRTSRSSFGVAYHLVDQGRVTPAVVLNALAQTFKFATVDLNNRQPTREATRHLTASMAREMVAVPFAVEGNILHVAMMDPFDLDQERRIREKAGHSTHVQTYVADEFTLRRTIKQTYIGGADLEVSLARAENSLLGDLQIHTDRKGEESVDDAEIPKFVDDVLRDGVQKGASDIHFEFYEDRGRIRYRIDGSLVEVTKKLDPRLGQAIVNRIKVKSDLNTAQDRVPDDGTTSLLVDGERHDFRVSTLPTVTGETVVLRILERNVRFTTIDDLGMGPREITLFRQALAMPQGMVLVTGPTGSGKSTTLYTALGILNDGDRKILTVEDPVERRVSGITQVNVRHHEDPKLNLDYATALKAFLRQDPNIIMVGEIRDSETAQISMRAAMTGHLVLSTLHTNDTAATVTRLMDIGVASYNIAAVIKLIVAQRLIRVNCPRCSAPYEPTQQEISESGFHPRNLEGLTFRRGVGCEYCNDTGYRGRQGLYEILRVSRAIKAAVAQGKSYDEIRDLAVQEGMITLKHAGLLALQQGVTTLEEVARETNF